jgi:hypothetical protein
LPIARARADKEGNVSGVTDEQNEPVTMTGRVIARSDVSTTINFNHLLAGEFFHKWSLPAADHFRQNASELAVRFVRC